MQTRQEGNTLIAEIDHFSSWGVGTTVGTSTGWMLPVNEATVALFDGGLSYSYPIRVPDGLGGMQPTLNLSYNSRRLDGVVTWVQSDWVGMGWSIDTMEIVRDAFRPQYTSYPGGDPDYENGYVDWGNRYSLLFNGTRYRLIPSTPNARGRYHTEDDQFVYVERRGNLGSGTNGSTANEVSEYWVVRGRDGTEYRLGYNHDSEQTFRARQGTTLYRETSTTVPESTFGYYDSPSGYTYDRVAYRWRVDKITDLRGNEMTFSYDEEEDACDDNYPSFREHASYLRTIDYNWDPQTGITGTQIVFARSSRSDGSVDDYGWDCYNAFHFQEDYLSSVRVDNWDATQGITQTVREYAFDYAAMAASVTDTQEVRLLDSITEYGEGGITTGSSLPATEFDYTAYDSKQACSSCGDEWKEESFPYERLSSIANGYGMTTTIEYGTLDDEEASTSDYDRTYNYGVVTRTTTLEIGDGNRVIYEYPEDNSERGYDLDSNWGCDFYSSGDTTGGTFIGFKYVTQTLQTEDGDPVSQSVHEFKLDTDASPDIRRGHEVAVWHQDPTTTPATTYLKVATDWQKELSLHDKSTLRAMYPVPDCYFVYPDSISEYWYNPTEPGTPQAKTENDYSLTLNTSRYYQNEADYVHLDGIKEYDNGTLVREKAYDYEVNATVDGVGLSASGPWITNKLSEVLVKDGTGNTLAGNHYIYDSQANTYTSTPTRGDLVRVERLRNSTSDWVPTELITYTQIVTGSETYYYGPTETSDANGNTTEMQYDAAWRLYPEMITNTLGHVSETTYDYVLGVPVIVTDTNDVATHYAYDDFGRQTKTWAYGDSESVPTIEYTYCDDCSPLAVTSSQRITAGTSISLTSISYYNGLGQLVQSQQVPLDKSELLITDYTYNAQGQQARAYLPYTATYSYGYLSPSGEYSVTTTYDAFGRPISAKSPDDSVTATAYDVFTTTMTDANGHVRATVRDALGRTTDVVEYSGTSPSHTEYATTEYAYDERDLLTSVTDDDGNETTITYDYLGRKTAMSDPDMGDWSYEYDDAGNLVRQEDARGQVTFFAYDALDRLLGKEYCHGDCDDVPSALDYDIEYHYDNATAGHYGKGRLHYSEVHGEDTLESFTYTARGNVAQTWFGTNGGYVLTDTLWTYNSANQVYSKRYECASSYETVNLGFDAWRRADTLSGDDNYVTGTSYDVYGRPTLITFGDNNQTSYVYRTPDHKESGIGQGGRLHYYQTGTSGDADAIQYVAYQYDAVGNVSYIWDVNNPGGGSYQRQQFWYDALDRLTRGDTWPNATGSGSYDLSYTYDEIGNLTQVTDNDASSSTTYGYGGGGAPTHALSATNSSQVAWYDDNGNMTMSTWPGEDRRALVYDAENRLTYAAVGDASSSSWVTAYGSGVSAGSWSTQNAYPRMLADADGDGKQDMVGFKSSNVYVSLSNGNQFGTPSSWTTYYAGWGNQNTYPRLMGDVTGDDKDDIVGFYSSATYVGPSTGNAFGGYNSWISQFGVSAGYTTFDSYPRALGDVDGDGKEDVVGFHSTGVDVGISSGSAFTRYTGWSSEFGYGAGAGSWTSYDDYPRLVGDVDGDGKADIVGFKDEGAWVALSDGSGFDSAELWLGWFANDTAAGDWDSFDDNPRVLADMNGDGKDDIVGFKSPGVWVSLSVGDRFLPPSVWVDDYSADSSWGDFDDEPRMAGDLTGDGLAEFVGCASTGVVVYGHDTYLDFGYNADGIMASATISDTGGVTTTTYVGDHQEWVGDKPTNYYFHNGRRVAMSVDGGDPIYMHADHLQSTTDTSGDTTSGTQYYYPYGEMRGGSEVATDYQYTGQRWQSALGLYYYRARWYDPQMRRFVQADTIVPEPSNPQDLNRYAYCHNNPVAYNDPSGHDLAPTTRGAATVHPVTGKVIMRGSWNDTVLDVHTMYGHSGTSGTAQRGNALEGMATVSDLAAYASRDLASYTAIMGQVFLGTPGTGSAALVLGLMASKDEEVTILDWGDQGFHVDFRDGKNQPFHVWGYVAQNVAGMASAQYGANAFILGVIGNYVHEIVQSAVGSLGGPLAHWGDGTSWQDYCLSAEGMILGVYLNNRFLSPSEVGDYMRDEWSPQGAGSYGLVPILDRVVPLQDTPRPRSGMY